MAGKVSRRGYIVIPRAIRRRHNIRQGDGLEWVDDGEMIRVILINADAFRALRGRATGEFLTEGLLAAGAEDRGQER